MKSITITSYNIHKGMSPTNRLVRLMGMKDALLKTNPDILCLQEVQGQNLKRTIDFAEFPDGGQHEWFGEFLGIASSYGKNAELARSWRFCSLTGYAKRWVMGQDRQVCSHQAVHSPT